MSKVLTSWKDIAQYFGKGVRTVQRWEAYFGLPVRRAKNGPHHAVLAVVEELDAWTNRQSRQPVGEMDALRREVTALREENAMLRRWLMHGSRAAQWTDPSEYRRSRHTPESGEPSASLHEG
jgi:hypothetical protein